MSNSCSGDVKQWLWYLALVTCIHLLIIRHYFFLKKWASSFMQIENGELRHWENDALLNKRNLISMQTRSYNHCHFCISILRRDMLWTAFYKLIVWSCLSDQFLHFVSGWTGKPCCRETQHQYTHVLYWFLTVWPPVPSRDVSLMTTWSSFMYTILSLLVTDTHLLKPMKIMLKNSPCLLIYEENTEDENIIFN